VELLGNYLDWLEDERKYHGKHKDPHSNVHSKDGKFKKYRYDVELLGNYLDLLEDEQKYHSKHKKPHSNAKYAKGSLKHTPDHDEGAHNVINGEHRRRNHLNIGKQWVEPEYRNEPQDKVESHNRMEIHSKQEHYRAEFGKEKLSTKPKKAKSNDHSNHDSHHAQHQDAIAMLAMLEHVLPLTARYSADSELDSEPVVDLNDPEFERDLFDVGRDLPNRQLYDSFPDIVPVHFIELASSVRKVSPTMSPAIVVPHHVLYASTPSSSMTYEFSSIAPVPNVLSSPDISMEVDSSPLVSSFLELGVVPSPHDHAVDQLSSSPITTSFIDEFDMGIDSFEDVDEF